MCKSLLYITYAFPSLHSEHFILLNESIFPYSFNLIHALMGDFQDIPHLFGLFTHRDPVKFIQCYCRRYNILGSHIIMCPLILIRGPLWELFRKSLSIHYFNWFKRFIHHCIPYTFVYWFKKDFHLNFPEWIVFPNKQRGPLNGCPFNKGFRCIRHNRIFLID